MKKLESLGGDGVIDDNIRAVKRFFPDAVVEGKVDFAVLRQLLGDAVLGEGDEKYEMSWHGKKAARQTALAPSLGTLRPCRAESVEWDKTRNLFIEGDNLEALKLLRRGYANKIKMIYIDPPYNTGKEFIYSDKWGDGIRNYLRLTGQVDGNGDPFSSNTDTGGRKHTNWLNMMYPRLRTARDLLRDDGVIFISIDDNEQANLKKICGEIFGEENFINCVAVLINLKGNNSDNFFAGTHEYGLVYAKNKSNPGITFNYFDAEEDMRNWEVDDLGYWKRGGILSATIGKTGENTNNNFPVYVSGKDAVSLERQNRDDVELFPYSENVKTRWYWGRKMFLNNLNEIIVVRNSGGKISLYGKQRVGFDEIPTKKPKSFLYKPGYGQGSIHLKNEFQEKIIFSNPKSISLLKDIAHIFTAFDSNDIVMDFFAGSGATARAVMQLNAEDGGDRRCISVQLPEPCDKESEAFRAGYKTVADIAKERIRRAAKKIQRDNPMFDGDCGFKVFKLDASNIREWSPDRGNIAESVRDYEENLLSGRSEEDLLYELLLRRGIDLTIPIAQKTVGGKTVYSVGGGDIFACLSDSIAENEVEELAAGMLNWKKECAAADDVLIVFRDSAFADDVAKVNMLAIFEQSNVAHVRSI